MCDKLVHVPLLFAKLRDAISTLLEGPKLCFVKWIVLGTYDDKVVACGGSGHDYDDEHNDDVEAEMRRRRRREERRYGKAGR